MPVFSARRGRGDGDAGRAHDTGSDARAGGGPLPPAVPEPRYSVDDEAPLTAPGGWSDLFAGGRDERSHTIRRGPSAATRAAANGKQALVRKKGDEPPRKSAAKGRLRRRRDSGESVTTEEEQGDETDDSDAIAARLAMPKQLYANPTTPSRGLATRPRAPIPFRQGISASDGGAAAHPHPSPYSPASTLEAFMIDHQSDIDTADVSAELAAETSLADISFETGAHDSAFETLTRIRAKDVAATSTPSKMISSPSKLHRNRTSLNSIDEGVMGQKGLAGAEPLSRLQRLTAASPMPAGWVQWGTAKVRSTMPRGIASALFALVGENEDARPQKDPAEEESEDGSDADEEPSIPFIVQECIDVICGSRTKGDHGLLDVEGLFRISPSTALLKSTREAYARGEKVDLDSLCDQDRHLPAALLKDHLRSKEPPLIPESLYEMIGACPNDDEDRMIDYLRTRFFPALQGRRRRGRENMWLFRCIMECAHEVTLHKDKNKMDASNLAVVLTPNLVRGRDVMRDMALCNVARVDASEKGSDHGETDKDLAKKMNRLTTNNETTLGQLVCLCIARFDDVFIDEWASTPRARATERFVEPPNE